jgi:3,4-dihydroxy 2-butanone 4-phosphate synthase/GTP cyclohydrolase II
LLYLRQEGRGIGLANKISAYALQERGLDTVEANLALGLPEDGRDYRVAAEMLLDLGVRRARLLTNNPAKVEGLKRHGVEIAERLPLRISPNPSNLGYLRTKREKMGHLLPVASTLEDAWEGSA